MKNPQKIYSTVLTVFNRKERKLKEWPGNGNQPLFLVMIEEKNEWHEKVPSSPPDGKKSSFKL